MQIMTLVSMIQTADSVKKKHWSESGNRAPITENFLEGRGPKLQLVGIELATHQLEIKSTP